MPEYTLASGARHGLSYIAEVTPGTTPTTPIMTSLRHTSCTLGLSRDSIQSNELRPDRQISDVRTGTDKIGGGIGVELSYGEYDTLLEAALCGAWTSDVLKAGTTRHPFTLQRAFPDIGQYGIFRGCCIDQFSLSIKPNAMITGSFDVVGISGEYTATTLCETPTASQTGKPFDSYTGVLKEGNAVIAVVTGIDLSLQNGVAAQYGLGSKNALAVTLGKSSLTGTLTAFFTNTTLLQKFVNETDTSLEVALQSGNGDKYTILLPRIRYTGGQTDASDDGPIQLNMPFTAILDPTENTNIKITRTDA